jgi:hypothetical protein
MMISFRNDSTRDVVEVTMFIEVYKVKEFFYRVIDRLYRLFGKGRYWIDCGFCDRKKGKMVCFSPARSSDDKDCYQGECYMVKTGGGYEEL